MQDTNQQSRPSRGQGRFPALVPAASYNTASSNTAAQALFLPEASDYIAGSAQESVALAKSVDDSVFVQGLCEEARRSSLPIHVGVHEPGDHPGKVKNTVLWIDERGAVTQRYQKVHLFDVDIKDGPVLKESEYVGRRRTCFSGRDVANSNVSASSVEKGDRILPPFQTPVGKVASAICFDV